MTASRKLGLERNIPESALLTIDSIHDKLEMLLDTYSLECDYQATQELFTQAEHELQSLWEFDQDGSRHTWVELLHEKHQSLRFPDSKLYFV